MSDETLNATTQTVAAPEASTVAAVTPPVTPEPSPAAVTPVSEPVISAPVATDTLGSPDAGVAKETPKEPEPAPTEVKPETLLGDDPKKPASAETNTTTTDKTTNSTNSDGGQTDNPAPPPSYETFKLPEGVQLDAGKVTEFTTLLQDLETSGKADHATVQAFGQKAVDFYVRETQKAMEDYNKLIMTHYEKQKTDWRESFMKDTEYGGNRAMTTVDAARSFIRNYGGTEEQQSEVRGLMESSGLGNNLAIIRLFAKANAALQEGKPLAAVKPPAPVQKSKTKTLYGSM